jgi:hypothetical protein
MTPVETVRPRLTFADLERMPDDGRRYELYDGEVVRSTFTNSRATNTACDSAPPAATL